MTQDFYEWYEKTYKIKLDEQSRAMLAGSILKTRYETSTAIEELYEKVTQPLIIRICLPVVVFLARLLRKLK